GIVEVDGLLGPAGDRVGLDTGPGGVVQEDTEGAVGGDVVVREDVPVGEVHVEAHPLVSGGRVTDDLVGRRVVDDPVPGAAGRGQPESHLTVVGHGAGLDPVP